MKYLFLALTGMAALTAPVAAQTTQPASTAGAAASPAAANVVAGAAVTDASGATVGTIESVSGDNAVLSTGTVKAALPLASFAKGPNGLVVGITKADLEAKVAQSKPQQITAGMAIVGPQGASVGKVDAVSGDLVTVATANSKAQLPKSAFAQGPDGGLMIGMTADQLDAAAKAAAGTPKGGAK